MTNEVLKRNGADVVAFHKMAEVEIYFRSDRIVEVMLMPIEYNKDKIDQVISRLNGLRSRDGLYLLISSHPDSTISMDGVFALFSRMSLTYSSAKAYVIHKKLHFFLSSLCMQVYKPEVPIKFFNSQTEAEKWLKDIISNSEE
jgi:hypothetical protein